ncbi:uncharacterized protein LOC144878581 isoform X4 [Branchiostoma floridae x Branchiostoma japonicum]
MAENPRQDLFLDISQNLVDAEIRDLRNYVIGAKILPAGFVEKANAHQIFNQLEKQQKLKLGDLSLLANILRKIGRNDYAEQAEELAENEMKDSSKEQSDLACKRRRLDTTETKGNEGLEPFAAIQHPVANLKELHLYDNKIGNVCLRSLAAVLHHLPCLKKLDLSCNSIRDADLASLATSLHHVPSLQFITLCNNPITEMDIKDFAQTIPKMPALKQLNLVPYKTAHLDDTASTSISTMLTRLPALERLNLTNISMQDAGFRDMVTAVEERSVDLKLLYSEHLVPRATTGSIQLCGDGPEDGNYDIFDLCSDDETSSD